jgi:RHS repeat-associated protein
VSNETPNIDVFFDNLQVTHIRGPLLEEKHYYPFGLTMAGISSKALNGAVENKKKFNGIEHNTDFDLNMYDAFYRNLDPQIGRFWQVDPKLESTEAWSPYAAMLDNPIRYADPLGDTVVLPNASEKFQKQFTEATSLLIAKGAGDLYIQAVESKGTIKVVETTDENSSYDPKTKTIS